MRIRFFNTFEPVTSFYLQIAPLLCAEGANINLVLSATEYRTGRDALESRLNGLNIQITRIPSGVKKISGKFQKLWTALSYMFGASMLSLFGRSADINFFLTQPPMFFLWGYILKIIRRQSYYCLLMDVYPDLLFESNALNRAGLLGRLLMAVSRFSLKRADKVIVIGRCMYDYLVKNGISPDRIEIILNWSDENKIMPLSLQDNHMLRSLKLENKFVIQYSGNMGISHYFDDLLEVARHLCNEEQIKFLFIGDGARLKYIEAYKRKYSLENIVLLPFQPVEKLAESLSVGNIHFISLQAGFEGLSVPSKAYGVLAAGRPIVYQGNETGEIARMILEEDIGSVLKLKDPDKLEKKILEYFENSQKVKEQGRKARKLAETKYSYRVSLQRYKNIIFESLH